MAGIGLTSAAGSIGGVNAADALKTGTQANDGSESFSSVLNNALENEENLSKTSSYDTLQLLSGNADNLSDLMAGAKKSEIAVNLTVAVRNKAMDAYKEIMNMQV